MICIGLKLYGYCGGHFGRDSYHDKRIEAFGADWIVARQIDNDGVLDFITFKGPTERDEFVVEFSKGKHSYDEDVKEAWMKKHCTCGKKNGWVCEDGCPAK